MVLQESGSNQTVKFIGRSLFTGSGSVVFTDETTNETHTYTPTMITDRHYTYFEETMGDLVEDHNYLMVVSGGGNELYRTNVFVTNQSIDSYSINNGAYTERSSTNEFVVLDD